MKSNWPLVTWNYLVIACVAAGCGGTTADQSAVGPTPDGGSSGNIEAASSTAPEATDSSTSSTAPEANASAPPEGGGPPADAAGGALGPWALTANYPLAANNCAGTAPILYCAQQTCVVGSGYIYCLGAESTSTYYSQLSSAGLGSWIPASDYPEPIENVSCVVSSNYVYCVGGYVGGADGGRATSLTADVYYAPLSPGIGTWTASTPFPPAAYAPTCMTDSGYIYCVSWDPDDSLTPDAYYASLSSSGVGAWTATTAPPAWTQGCSAVGGYAYCFGGGGCPADGPGSDCYSPSYFAPLTANGIGTWKTTTELPTAVSANYATAGSYIYYLSIPVFFASVSADGIGPWQTTTNYPDSPYPANCFSSEGYLYCASPVANSSYFAQIGVPNPQALQLENPPPFPRSQYLVPAWNNGGGASVNGVGAPTFGDNIDDAVVFNCASQASTSTGCATTAVSSNTAYNYALTVWFPCTSPTPANANCCFLPAVGYPTPFTDWCISVGSDSFIIASEIAMQQAPAPTTSMPDGGDAWGI